MEAAKGQDDPVVPKCASFLLQSFWYGIVSVKCGLRFALPKGLPPRHG